MKLSVASFVAVVLSLLPQQPVSGQEPGSGTGVPCRVDECALVLEFSGIDASTTNGRYGSPAMFEPQFLASLVSIGYRVSRDAPQSGTVLALMQPRLARAICDAVPGTNTPRCPVLSDVTVELRRPDQDPVRTTVRNRCSADSYMNAEQFGQYAAQVIDFWLRKAEGSPPRPRAC